MSVERRVVITGLGVASPLGVGASAFWDGLMESRNAVGPITGFDASALPSRIGSELSEFKLTDFIPKTYRKSVKLMARDIVVAVIAACEAARDATLATKCLVDRGEAAMNGVDPTRFGVNIGAGLICPDLNELGAAFATGTDSSGAFDLKVWGEEGMRNLTPLWLLKFLPNMLACHVSIIHDAQSISNTITCGEVSSHLAIGEAYRNIARGAMDVCLCGGAESKIAPMPLARAALMERLVTDGDASPASACRPFAADRRGTVVSEGGAIVVLESLEHAKSRGARIYAEVGGFGAAGNTYSWDAPDPSGAPIALAIDCALKDASLSAQRIDLITVFGTGIRDYDASELQAWKRVLGDRYSETPGIAIKGGLGNNGAGSGALDVCATVLSLHYNTVPPSVNTTPVDPVGGPKFATDGSLDHRIDAAVTVGYALGGGQSAALVIKRYTE